MRVGAGEREVLVDFVELKSLGGLAALRGIGQKVRVADGRGDRGVRRTAVEQAGAGLHLVDVLVVDVFLRLGPEHFGGGADAPDQIAVIAECGAENAREAEVGIRKRDVLDGVRRVAVLD